MLSDVILPLIFLSATSLGTQANIGPVIPNPTSVEMHAGTFPITLAAMSIVAPKGAAAFVPDLESFLSKRRVSLESVRRHKIRFELSASVANLGPEGYDLVVSPDEVVVKAPKAAGLFYGAQTLKQMTLGARGGSIPCVHISDKPRFEWRGMLLDVSRHFFNVQEVKKTLDYLSELKMNVFHWHLIDDGGWRVEIKKYPKLTQQGSYRLQRPGEIWNYSNIEFVPENSKVSKYGGYYTQDQIREVVRYAADRNITIVPEIEMPGHCLPAMVAQPEVSCSIPKTADRPYRALAYCAGKEATFKFIEDVLDEVMQLFPSKVIHIGGDEVDKYYWSKCPDCQARKKSEHLKDEHELQSYFIRRVEKFLNSRGRDLMGWDEILEGGLAPNAQVMSWRGEAGGIAAAKSGHRVAMSPTSHCYFDFSYESISTAKVYGYEPVPAELPKDKHSLVRGAQANVWTEWMPNYAKVEQMIFPRIVAMAETLWTPPNRKDYADFTGRLNQYVGRLAELGANMNIDAPEADANLIIFEKDAKIEFRQTKMPGVELRIAKNGTPSMSSPIYQGPITTTEPTEYSAQNFINGKAVGAISKVAARRYRSPVKVIHGITYDVYERSSGLFQNVPNFASIQSVKSGTVETISLTGLSTKLSYALRFRMQIKIKRAGVYTFSTSSDDGSNLWIGESLVVMNDYSQGMTERSGRAVLTPGSYDVTVGYFQEGGAAGLKAAVQGPGLSKTDITTLVVP